MSRPTIGMLTNCVVGLHEVQWLGVVDAARKYQANLLTFAGRELGRPDNFYTQANVIFDLVSPEQIDGLIIWTTTLQVFVGQQQLETFCQRYRPLPIVSVEQVLAGSPSLLMDNKQGMYAAISHLIEVHGYRRIAFIRGPVNHSGAQERYQGYLEALAHHGLPFDPSLVSPPLRFWLSEEAAAAAHRLLDAQTVAVEAIAATNDNMALGALAALQARHIRVPRDMAVVGFDNRTNIDRPNFGVDTAFGADTQRAVNIRATTLPLTTVQPPFYELGWRAVQLLLAQLQGEDVPSVVSLPTELIVRRSCGCFSAAVREIAPAPLGALPAKGRQHSVLGEAIAAGREQIVAQLEQAMGLAPAELPPDWAEHLLTAFVTEVQDEASDAFFATLDEMVRDSLRTIDDLSRWWQVLFALRRQILPYLLTDRAAAQAETVWQRTQALMGELGGQFYVYQQLVAEKQDEILREIGQLLITTFDLDQLAGILVQELPNLGIPSCYLALYAPSPQSTLGTPAALVAPEHYPTTWARAILIYEQQQIQVTPGEELFPSRQLAPGKRLRRAEPFSMVLEPLYFREQQLGFVLFEAGPRQGWIYEALRGQLSSALQGALLVEREEQALVEAQAARVSAEAANETKSQFLANMSHELRTPLNAIINFAELAIQNRERYGPIPERYDFFFQRIRYNGAHLLGLINDVLDLAKIEAGRMDLICEPIRLRPLLNGIMSSAQGLAKDKPIEIKLDAPEQLPPIVADQGRLRQILLNLLSNAVKFTERGTITIHVQPTADGMLACGVQDTGIGIAPEHQALIFEEFRQVQNEGTRGKGGTGLGLPICKRLVEMHGGTIWLESAPGQGSTFWFTLPLSGVASQATPAAAEQSAAQSPNVAVGDPQDLQQVAHYGGAVPFGSPDVSGYTMVVVDDMQENLLVIDELIQTDLRVGYYRSLTSGAQLYALLARETGRRLDLILLDLQMRDEDGYTLLRKLRAMPQLRQTKLVAFTANVMPQHVEQARAAGFDGFIGKPIVAQRFPQQIRRILAGEAVWEPH